MISHLGIMFAAGLGRWLSRSDLVHWHQAADCCASPIRSLSEAQRTCRERVGRVDPTLFDPTRKQRVHRSNRDDFFNSGWFSDAVATSRAATACQNILASQHQRLGLEHWTRRLVSGHSAQCLSATTPMAMPRNNKKNAGIQFGSNGTTYLHPVPGVKMA
jgi:hypothetical protein